MIPIFNSPVQPPFRPLFANPSAEVLTPITGMSTVGNLYTAAEDYAYIGTLNSSGDIYLMNFRTAKTIEALRFDGTDLSVVGSSYDASGDGAFGPQNADGATQIANNKMIWFDHGSDDMYLYTFNGSTWTLEASQLNLFDLTGYPSGHMLQENQAVIGVGNSSGSDDAVQVIEYDGSSTISKVGNPITFATFFTMPVVMSATRIAIVDTAADTVQAYDWDGTDFSAVGSTYSIAGSVGRIQCIGLGSNELVVWVGNDLHAIEFDGSSWTQKATLSIGATSWPRSMAKINNSRIAVHYYGSAGNIAVIDIARE